MMNAINTKTHAVIDLRSCTEIPGAVAADTDTGEVIVIRKTGQYMDVLVEELTWMPSGVRVVRR
jgi:hypothetical protein